MIFGGPMVAAARDLITLQMPNIPGDLALSKALGLPAGSIEILSLSGGVSEVTPFSSAGSGAGAHMPNFSSLSLTKRFDGASPAVFLATASGKAFPQALVTFYHVTQGGVTAYYTITLTQVFVSSDQFAGIDKNSALDTESFKLDYGQIQLTDVATATTSCWNVVQNTTC
jgi:type VI secretion system Hcp family effector